MCSYCPQKILIKNYKKLSSKLIMTFDDFKLYLNNIPNDYIITFGGFSEPFLNPDMLRMLLYAYDCGYKLDLFTTLVGITKQDILSMGSAEIDFDRAVVHLPNINEHFMDKKEYLYLLDLFCNNISIGKLEFEYFGFVDDDIVDLLLKHGYSPFCGTMSSRGGYVYVPKYQIGGGFCATGHENHHILLPSGDVVLCCMDFGCKHVLGNLKDDNINDLNFKKPFIDIKKKQRLNDSDIICRKCDEFIPFFSLRFFNFIMSKFHKFFIKLKEV